MADKIDGPESFGKAVEKKMKQLEYGKNVHSFSWNDAIIAIQLFSDGSFHVFVNGKEIKNESFISKQAAIERAKLMVC